MENTKLLMENEFKVVGRLTSAEVKIGNRQSDGAGFVSVEAIVTSVIGGQTNEYQISFFANELTQDKKVSKLYESYAKMESLIGKKVSVTGSIRENRFWSANQNQLVSSQQLSGKFVKTEVETTPDVSSFKIGGFLGSSVTERRNKNDEVYRYDVVIGQVNYNGDNMSRFVFHINPADREVVAGVEGYSTGDTVLFQGSLNFVSETVTVSEQVGFGKPITKTYTNKQKNFYIEGGLPAIEDERAYTLEVIQKLKAAYDAKGVEIMNAQKSVEKSAPAPVTTATPVTKRQAALI